MAEDWQRQLIKELETYTGKMIDEIDKAVSDIAKEEARFLSHDAPKRTGRYRAGFTSRKSENSTKTARLYVVHNKDRYQLTHLLEHGHGGPYPASPHPHFAQAERDADEKLEAKIKEIISRG